MEGRCLLRAASHEIAAAAALEQVLRSSPASQFSFWTTPISQTSTRCDIGREAARARTRFWSTCSRIVIPLKRWMLACAVAPRQPSLSSTKTIVHSTSSLVQTRTCRASVGKLDHLQNHVADFGVETPAGEEKRSLTKTMYACVRPAFGAAVKPNLAHNEALRIAHWGPEARGAASRNQAARRSSQRASFEAGHSAGRLPSDHMGRRKPSRAAGDGDTTLSVVCIMFLVWGGNVNSHYQC